MDENSTDTQPPKENFLGRFGNILHSRNKRLLSLGFIILVIPLTIILALTQQDFFNRASFNEVLDPQTHEMYDTEITSEVKLIENPTNPGPAYIYRTVFNIHGTRVENTTSLYGFLEKPDGSVGVINFKYDPTSYPRFKTDALDLSQRNCMDINSSNTNNRETYIATFCYDYTVARPNTPGLIRSLNADKTLSFNFFGSENTAVQTITTAYDRYLYPSGDGSWQYPYFNRVSYFTFDFSKANVSSFTNVKYDLAGITNGLSNGDQAKVCALDPAKFLRTTIGVKPEGGRGLPSSGYGSGACTFLINSDRFLSGYVSLDMNGGLPGLSVPTPTPYASAPLPPIDIPTHKLVVSNYTPKVSIYPGQRTKIMTVTSTAATSFSFYGNPYIPGVNYSPSGGGILNGGSVDIYLEVQPNVSKGEYSGIPVIISSESNSHFSLPQSTAYVGLPLPTSTPAPTPTPTPTPVLQEPPYIETQSLPNITVGADYSATVKAYDNNVSDTLAMDFNSTPAGLTLGSCSQSIVSNKKYISCLISGRITTPRSTIVDLRVYDSKGGSQKVRYNMFAENQAPAISTANIPQGTVNTPYQATITGEDSSPSDNLAPVSSALPSGFTFGNCVSSVTPTQTKSISCKISGASSVPVDQNVTITLFDDWRSNAQRTYRLKIN